MTDPLPPERLPVPHKPADNDDDLPPSVPMPQRMPMPVPQTGPAGATP
jgi:hypothetical protein